MECAEVHFNALPQQPSDTLQCTDYIADNAFQMTSHCDRNCDPTALSHRAHICANGHQSSPPLSTQCTPSSLGKQP